jgi:lipid-binding SYLF domain-containing protein
MKSILHILFASVLVVSIGTLAAAPVQGDIRSVENEKASRILEQAVRILDFVMADTEYGIPHSLINQSEGIVIFPGACMVAAGPYNGPGGIGIAMIRHENGSWSDPFVVILREGSQDFEIGTKNSDIVLLFKDRNHIMGVHNGAIRLGGDLGVAPGPADEISHSATAISFDKEVYAYDRSKGHFAGESYEGGILTYYEKLSNSL